MQINFYQAGFDWAAWGSEPAVTPLRRTTEEKHFDRGVSAGRAILAAVGGLKRLAGVVAHTETLQRRALNHHALVLDALGRLPEKERAEMLLAARLEPCATCRNIAICAATALTCEAFRHYASGIFTEKPSRVPDESFIERERRWQPTK
jgi:hypothetical protein